MEADVNIQLHNTSRYQSPTTTTQCNNSCNSSNYRHRAANAAPKRRNFVEQRPQTTTTQPGSIMPTMTTTSTTSTSRSPLTTTTQQQRKQRQLWTLTQDRTACKIVTPSDICMMQQLEKLDDHHPAMDFMLLQIEHHHDPQRATRVAALKLAMITQRRYPETN